MWQVILGVGLTLACASNSWAISANELLNHCESRERVIAEAPRAHDEGWAMACTGYVMGVVDILSLYRGGQFCPSLPDNIQYDQGAKIIVKYLREHPATLHNDASFEVYKAFTDAYPCTQ